ncbi:MAG: 30S ribosome-binding factor RbfA [Acidobacteriota bacterium]|nr:30S ribosome-binding factor RbfA [Acidobacteriota bacterium]
MRKESSYRPKRVSHLIQQEISQYLINELPEMTAFLTVIGVEMPADLKTAKISVSVLEKNKRQPVLELLEKKAPHFRRLLAARLNLRYNPELIFILDTSVDQEEKIDRLLALVKKNEPINKS